MTTSIAIIQYEVSDDSYKMRIGEELIPLPTELTDKIGMAIAKVGEFNTEHAMIAHEIWEGDFKCEPDIIEVGYDQERTT